MMAAIALRHQRPRGKKQGRLDIGAVPTERWVELDYLGP